MSKRASVVVVVTLLLVVGCDGGDEGEQARALRIEQVTEGREVYEAECAECHGAELEGVSAPSLDAEGLSHLENAAALQDYVSEEMPLDAPGSLGDAEYQQVTAYILDKGGLLPADEPLTDENAPGIDLAP